MPGWGEPMKLIGEDLMNEPEPWGDEDTRKFRARCVHHGLADLVRLCDVALGDLPGDRAAATRQVEDAFHLW